MAKRFCGVLLFCFFVSVVLAGGVWGKDAGKVRLEDLLAQPEEKINLTTAALVLAEGVEENFEGIDFYTGRLEEMASVLAKRIKGKNPEEAVAVMGKYLFEEVGFRYELGLEKGSFLSFTLREKKGNSLGIATIYLALAETLGLPLFGVYVPKHVLVRYDDGKKAFFIDTGDKGKIHPEEYYQKNFPIPEENEFYLRKLKKKEVMGILLHERGVFYAGRGRFDEALADYERALAINPDFAEAYNSRGLLYKELGRFDEALADYSKAVALNPRMAEGYNNRAIVYFNLGRLDEALADYNRAIELSPKYAEAYYNRGNLYKAAKRYDDALSDYKKAIELKDGFVEAYINRGLTYSLMKRYKEAIADYTKAIKLESGFLSEAYYDRGIAYYFLERYKEAVADYRKAIEYNPKSGEAYYGLALAYDKLNRPKEALEAYRKFVEYAPPGQEKALEYAKKRIKALSGK
ncbi:MAG: tetratricopeptide repeat protein [Treponemataceae bacterium]|nr:tetratricopeptide repeat protein [Treponemataceae bacterium]